MKNRLIFGMPIVLLAVLYAFTNLSTFSHAKFPKDYVFHGFQFGMFPDECKGVEVLNFQYGSTRTTGLHADAGYLAAGHIPQSESSFGLFPVGDILFVKWKDLSTNNVYEERVDLKGRLPSHMDHKIVHFSIQGKQLYVHVIERNMHVAKSPDCPVWQFRDYKCTTIYPQRWSNF